MSRNGGTTKSEKHESREYGVVDLHDWSINTLLLLIAVLLDKNHSTTVTMHLFKSND